MRTGAGAPAAPDVAPEMADISGCRLYLIVEIASSSAAALPDDAALWAVCDQHDVACVELAVAGPLVAAEDLDRLDTLRRLIDRFLTPLQQRGIAVLLHDAPELAFTTGCDGVRVSDPAAYRTARQVAGNAQFVGVTAGTSRHDAMVAGEAGADFVGLTLDRELVSWWAEAVEIPCVVFGITSGEALTGAVAAGADFVAVTLQRWHTDPRLAAAWQELQISQR